MVLKRLRSLPEPGSSADRLRGAACALALLLLPAAALAQVPLVLRATLPVTQPAQRLFAFDADGDGDLDLFSGPAAGPGSIELHRSAAGAIDAPLALTPARATFGAWTPCLADADALADLCYADAVAASIHYQVQLAGPALDVVRNGSVTDGASALDVRPADVSAGADGQFLVLEATGGVRCADPSPLNSIPLPSEALPAASLSVRAADVDGDGRTDALGLGAASLAIGQNAGLPNLWNPPVSIPLAGLVDVVAGELDGLPGGDLAAVDAAGTVTLVSDALGAAATTTLATLGAAVAIAALDLDGDGDLDLAIARPGPAVSLLRGDGAGGFVDEGSFALPAASAITALAVADLLDADGRPELVVAQGADGLALLGPGELPPVIDAVRVAPDPVPEGALFTVEVTARPPEAGQALTYELQDLLGAFVDGPTASASLTATAPRLCEAAGDVRLRSYTLRVVDPAGLDVVRPVDVQVQETLDELPTCTVPVGPVQLEEGVAESYSVVASDDCGAPTVTWSSSPPGLALVATGTSVEVTAPDACGDASFELVAEVTDGRGQAGVAQRLSLDVIDRNAPPPTLQPPAALVLPEDQAAEWLVPLTAPCGVAGLSCTASLPALGALSCRVEADRLVISVAATPLCADLSATLELAVDRGAGPLAVASIPVTAQGSNMPARFVDAAEAPGVLPLASGVWELRAPAVVDDACAPTPLFLFAEVGGAGRVVLEQDGGPIARLRNELAPGAPPLLGCSPSAELHVSVDGSAPSAPLALALPILDTTPPTLVPPAAPAEPARRGAPVTLVAAASDDCGTATIEGALSAPERATLRQSGGRFEIEPVDCRAEGAVTLTLLARDAAGQASAPHQVAVRLASSPSSPVLPAPQTPLLAGEPLALALDVTPGCGGKVCVVGRAAATPPLLGPDGAPAPRCSDGRLTLLLSPAEQLRYFPPHHRLVWDVQDEAGGPARSLEVAFVPAGDLVAVRPSIASPDARPGEVVAVEITLESRLEGALQAPLTLRLDPVGLRLLPDGVTGADAADDVRALGLVALPAAPRGRTVTLWAERTEEPGPPSVRARLYTADGRPISPAADAAPAPSPYEPGLSCATGGADRAGLATWFAALLLLAARRRRRV